MQNLEVSRAVRDIYIYIYIYDISRLRVKAMNLYILFENPSWKASVDLTELCLNLR